MQVLHDYIYMNISIKYQWFKNDIYWSDVGRVRRFSPGVWVSTAYVTENSPLGTLTPYVSL